MKAHMIIFNIYGEIKKWYLRKHMEFPIGGYVDKLDFNTQGYKVYFGQRVAKVNLQDRKPWHAHKKQDALKHNTVTLCLGRGNSIRLTRQNCTGC